MDSGINNLGSLAGYSTGVGEGNTTAASNFYQNILSGDPSKIGQSLAPEISSGQQQAEQAKNSLAQFGARSGGTAGAASAIDAGTRGNLINLIGGMQTGAAQGAGNLGTQNLGLAANDTMDQSKLAQQRMQNWLNSILGQGTSQAAGALESFALGKMLPSGQAGAGAGAGVDTGPGGG